MVFKNVIGGLSPSQRHSFVENKCPSLFSFIMDFFAGKITAGILKIQLSSPVSKFRRNCHGECMGRFYMTASHFKKTQSRTYDMKAVERGRQFRRTMNPIAAGKVFLFFDDRGKCTYILFQHSNILGKSQFP